MDRPSDRCPGVFATHPGADGQVARVRLPGGLVRPAQLEALADLAELGDGFLELTGRANVQIRGLPQDVPTDGLVDSGLVRSAEHDRVRNVMVSPLSGRDVAGRPPGRLDVRPLAAAMDAAVLADDSLAGLPGRILFGFDTGVGDVVAHEPDLGVVGVDADTVEILLAGHPTGRVLPAADAVELLRDLARSFLAERSDEWRIAHLDDATMTRLTDQLAQRTRPAPARAVVDVESAETGPLVGWFDQEDGSVLLGAVVPLGRIPARTARFLAAIGAPIVVTPDREILVCDLAEGVADTVLRVLAPMGVVFDATSPWARVSSCAGAPGCARSYADVRADLTDRVGSGGVGDDREHWVGCDRGCGTPHSEHVRVVAGPDGYRREPHEGHA